MTILAPSNRVADTRDIPGFVRIGGSVPVRGNGSVARIALSFHLVRRVRSLLNRADFDVVHYHEPLVPGLPITTCASTAAPTWGPSTPWPAATSATTTAAPS